MKWFLFLFLFTLSGCGRYIDPSTLHTADKKAVACEGHGFKAVVEMHDVDTAKLQLQVWCEP